MHYVEPASVLTGLQRISTVTSQIRRDIMQDGVSIQSRISKIVDTITSQDQKSEDSQNFASIDQLQLKFQIAIQLAEYYRILKVSWIEQNLNVSGIF